MRDNYLLDMDGVLCDFTSGALHLLNHTLNQSISLTDYVNEKKGWNIQESYGISVNRFWDIIGHSEDFWYNLRPFPWAQELVNFLRELGDVTIVTTPSLDPNCAKQKLEWLDYHLGIKSNDVFLGAKKYLMVGNGILIDDYPKNVQKFHERGGHAILVPSNWNIQNLTFEQVKQTIINNL